ncbi:IclR family transcriptional regulator [Pararhizobium sp. BT-229]|uniref:IclR family transcriptional regulator n=1 Tax=Pararhizobium sp. BT-229 TaxID=2986923 RepID=UPI0021F79E4C|nr:IclR family transcriptional regulator [Pararhizobium sp. BT-229]MCV9966315.1 IclR family transcriptional regulator [Pararhizobium sp. BT-229]
MLKTPKPAVETPAKEELYRAPALDKGLDILELLSGEPGGLTRAEIVKAMGRSPGEVYRMLERLVVRDYVNRSREGDRYSLSMKLFVLAHRHPPVRRLVARALPLMDELCRTAGQSCHLVAPDRDAATVVAHASPPGNWEFGIRIGARVDLIGSGSGLTLLAFQSSEEREALEERWARNPEKLAALRDAETALATLRETGWRVGDSGQIVGVKDISAPVLSPDGHTIAALTCPYIQRLDEGSYPNIEATLTLLRDTVSRLSLS